MSDQRTQAPSPALLQTVAYRLLILSAPFYNARETGGTITAAEAAAILLELETCAHALMPDRAPCAAPAGRFVHAGGRA